VTYQSTLSEFETESESGPESVKNSTPRPYKRPKIRVFHLPPGYTPLYDAGLYENEVSGRRANVPARGDDTVYITSKDRIDGSGQELFGADIPNAGSVHGEQRCKYCGSQELIKWGHYKNGDQKYKCKDCGHYFALNGKFPRMRFDYRVVSAALEWYYSGFSLKKVARQLKRIFHVSIVVSTVRYWIDMLIPKIKSFVQRFQASGPGLWHVDETVVKAGGDIHWYWEVIDRKTKFILATEYTRTRTKKAAIRLFRNARKRKGGKPGVITCDKLPAYERAVHTVFGYWTGEHNGKVALERNRGPGTNPSNAYIERFHNTLKERTKTMRGLYSLRTGQNILDGFVIFYNWLRPHETLQERTPAQASGIDLDLEGGFADLIQYAISS